MLLKTPSFTLGIEEEYLLVNKQSRELVQEAPESLIEEAAEACGGQVSAEFLQSQIEVGTRVCESVAEAREDLVRLRRGIIEVAGRHGLAPIAASTHPFANWQSQRRHTAKERFAQLESEMQDSARRMVICGMHVHVGIEDDALRIDLMNQLSYFLPHLLALSSSSPFWQGKDTGLKSYRMTVYAGLPRTGLPTRFTSWGEYRRHMDFLIEAGVMEDMSKIWWDVRPSGAYPTLETRIMDVCTRVEDAVCVAALVVCILRMLHGLRLKNQRWREYSNLLIRENRWRAIRYGSDAGMLDLARAEIRPFADLLEELLELVGEEARQAGCLAEVAHAREILRRGTSAHEQLRVYEAALAGGAEREEALRAVVDRLIASTAEGL